MNTTDEARAGAARRLQQLVTLGALIAASAHLIWPSLAIDAVTIALLVAAAIPWLAPLFKTLELPGGWKIEFQELAARQVKIAAAIGAASARRLESTASAEEVALEARAAASAVTSAITPRVVRGLKERRILWVDDRPDNNVFERQALEVLGIRFVLSRSTEDALAKLKSESFDAVISDVSRPSDSQAGYTLLGKIRGSGDQTPFLIYAGSRAAKDEAEAKRRGAQGATNQPGELFEMVLEAVGIRAGRHE